MSNSYTDINERWQEDDSVEGSAMRDSLWDALRAAFPYSSDLIDLQSRAFTVLNQSFLITSPTASEVSILNTLLTFASSHWKLNQLITFARKLNDTPALKVFEERYVNGTSEPDKPDMKATQGASVPSIVPQLSDSGEISRESSDNNFEADSTSPSMTYTAVFVKLLQSSKAVARIRIPVVKNGLVTDHLPTGTGWLISREYALTCWHVIEERTHTYGDMSENVASPADLDLQVKNMLFTFDFTEAGEGIDYGVSALICDDPVLDYALLSLQDRQDAPLANRGSLQLEPDAPLTAATELYVIQHANGRPQQNSHGRFVRYSTDKASMILYDAPAEPGTSGAPLLDFTDWKAVGLHRGVQTSIEGLHIATPIKAILDDIKRQRPDIANQIGQS